MVLGVSWSLWLSAGSISTIVVALAVLALRRGARVTASGAGEKREMRIYADQLREIERDRARGVIAPGEAERLRAETARRLLDADRRTTVALIESPTSMKVLALLMVVAVPLGAGALYWRVGAPAYADMPLVQRFDEAAAIRAGRPSQTAMEAGWLADPNRPPARPVDAQFLALMAQLREALAGRPDDRRGLRLLAVNERAIGNNAESAAAWARLIDLQGDAAPVEDLAALAESMALAAGGQISPQAEQVLEQILQRDPRNGAARYFLGLMFAQTGRPDATFRLWRGLLEDSNPDDPWVPAIRGTIEELADVAGVRYTLPPVAGSRGPTAADMANAADMTPEERQQMIGGMVEGLAARLANQGGSAEEWARLIGALGTLGQAERARAIWAEARSVFADQPGGLAQVEAAARAQGFTE